MCHDLCTSLCFTKPTISVGFVNVANHARYVLHYYNKTRQSSRFPSSSPPYYTIYISITRSIDADQPGEHLYEEDGMLLGLKP